MEEDRVDWRRLVGEWDAEVVNCFDRNEVQIYIVNRVGDRYVATVAPTDLILKLAPEGHALEPTFRFNGVDNARKMLEALQRAIGKYLKNQTEKELQTQAELEKAKVVIEQLEDRVADLRAALGIKDPMIRRFMF